MGVHITLLPQKDEFGNINSIDVFGNPLESKDTDINGKYEYCNLIPGDYKVKFSAKPDANGKPYLTTKANVGDDKKDSDIPEFKESNGTSPTVTLKSGDNNDTIDAGFIQPICLGDYVWYDENLNGIQDSQEAGIIGIKVKITDRAGNPIKDLFGNIVADSATDNKGRYAFCNLIPNRDYLIKFEIPKSYLATKQNQGSDAADSDADSKGVIDVTKELGQKPTQDNYTLDLGIYCECDDYLVHPENYKELRMPALNIAGLLLMIAALYLIIRKEEK